MLHKLFYLFLCKKIELLLLLLLSLYLDYDKYKDIYIW